MQIHYKISGSVQAAFRNIVNILNHCERRTKPGIK